MILPIFFKGHIYNYFLKIFYLQLLYFNKYQSNKIFFKKVATHQNCLDIKLIERRNRIMSWEIEWVRAHYLKFEKFKLVVIKNNDK